MVLVETVGAVVPRDGEKTVAVTVCLDTSGADLVDPVTDRSVLPEDRQLHMRWVVDTVTEGSRWKVEETSTEDIESCN